MIRALLYIVGIVLAAIGLSWLADRPGELVVNWQGYEIQTSVFRAIVMVALLALASIVVWSVVRQVLASPSTLGHFVRRRRHERGFEALSAGMIAVGSGDRALSTHYAKLAHRSMPNEPLTHLLRAQTAQLSGDRATARRIYEAMRNNPETELLGLRGLYLEAQQENEPEAARQYAERAVTLNPRLGWSVESLFAIQCKDGDWESALDTLGKARKNNQMDKRIGDRRRAVLLTAQASEAEENEAARALALATEAHGLAPDLVPAAAIAGRLLASQGATPRAAKILQRTWRQSPHPDIAAAYAYARIGDSPRDRLKRIRELASLTPHNDEGQIAVAVAAIDAQDWEAARRALRHLVEGKPSQRVCTLMARIEGGEHNDTGKVREWLARAVSAPRDPAWVADGHVSSKWAPVSPVTGVLDAYVWQQPADTLERADSDLLIEQLVPAKEAAVPSPVDRAGAEAAEEVIVEKAEPAKSEPPHTRDARQPAVSDIAARSIPTVAVSSGARTTGPDAATGHRSPLTAESGRPALAHARVSSAVTHMQSPESAKTVSGHAADPLAVLRAPDDPGPDAPEAEEMPVAMTRFRVPATKDSQQ